MTLKLEDIDMKNILYDRPFITTDLGNRVQIVFADDTASGRPSKMIDNMIQERIMPYYSNTHSNAYCGIKMKKLIQKTRDKIREYFCLTKEHKVLFSGNGSTGAINHLAQSINYNKYVKVYIYISTYEHYSNHLPWVEMKKRFDNIEVIKIPFKDDDIDLDKLKNNLAKSTKETDVMNIVTITACSNVTGIMTNVNSVIDIVSKFNKEEKKVYLFLDCACVAPYRRMCCECIDALFVSMHKFVGGTGSPGLLIAKEELFVKNSPFCAGGGCVKKANSHVVEYEDDIEKKEGAGTPNIVGIIRIKYILEFVEKHYDKIKRNEEEITKYVYNKFKDFPKDFQILMNNDKFLDRRLPIVSFYIKDMHYNFIVVLLNDLYGIQSRGGVSCCGMLSEFIQDKTDINGWCRVTFNWMMDKKTIDYIIDAIRYIVENGNKYKDNYEYDEEANLFIPKVKLKKNKKLQD
uniref:Aminotransferase class V domain-containing protein n=1 Tax=viral metagenome TaxID=1070528 RepID=A0A6C0EE35_9ZZZZ